MTQSSTRRRPWRSAATPEAGIDPTGPDSWKLVAGMVVLGITVAGFLGPLKRQDQKLELLFQRITPVGPQA